MESSLLDLRDRVVLLTGGLGGIGTEVAACLHDHGARVAVVDLEPEEAATRLRGWGSERLCYLRHDIADPDGMRAALERVEQVWGLPDVVGCHAGIAHSEALATHPVEAFDDVLRVNLRAPFLLARAAVRAWLDGGRPGQLIFTGSWVQDVPWPGVTPYAASKAGLRALARGFAREHAADGIRANVVAPGIVDTGMARRQWDTEPDYRRRASRAIPLGRLQPPESVAHAFLFLCSPMSAYMTGTTLLVDGGASLYPMDDGDAP